MCTYIPGTCKGSSFQHTQEDTCTLQGYRCSSLQDKGTEEDTDTHICSLQTVIQVCAPLHPHASNVSWVAHPRSCALCSPHLLQTQQPWSHRQLSPHLHAPSPGPARPEGGGRELKMNATTQHRQSHRSHMPTYILDKCRRSSSLHTPEGTCTERGHRCSSLQR